MAVKLTKREKFLLWISAEELRSVYEMVTCGYDYWPSRIAPRGMTRTLGRCWEGPIPIKELCIVESIAPKEKPKCSNTTDL